MRRLFTILLLAWATSVRALAADEVDVLDRMLLDDPQAAYDQAFALRARTSRTAQPDIWIRAATDMAIGLSYLGRFGEIEAVLQDALELARDTHAPHLEGPLLIQKARYLENRGQSQEALELLHSLEQHIGPQAPPRLLVGLATNLANFTLKYGNESEAALYVQRAFETLKTQPHDHSYYALLNNIGSAYMKLSVEDREKAISIFKEVTRYALSENLRFLGNLAAYNLGLCLADVQRWEEAMAAYRDSLKFAEAMGDVQSIAFGHFGIGISWNGLERHEEALPEFLQALSVFEKQENDFSAFEVRLELLKVYVKLNQFAQADAILKHIHSDPLLKGALVPMKSVAEDEALLRVRMGRYEEAVQHYQTVIALMKQLEKTRNVELVKKYNAQFEVERQTQTNERLKAQLEGNRRFNLVLFLCIGLVALISVIMTVHAFRIRRKNRKIEELQSYIENNILQRFLPQVMVQEVLEGRSRLEESAKMETVTVLFADLCDFTLATDQLGAQTIAHMLNDFFLHMTDIVLEAGGTVDKFIGDAIMVLFGVPDHMPPEEQARRAALCAERMQEGLKQLNARWQNRATAHSFAMRIGIHQGAAVVGSFGGKRRSDYTVVGNSVNIAARIEAIAEANDIVFSPVIAAQLPEARCRRLGEFSIRGIREPMILYALIPDLARKAS